ncbi:MULTISPECIES: polymer-forming cytoskeletal protein [Cellvibrio]|jgi:cytoskeletal protein CcmA (bactofilin family)|uniref:Cytoskeletal protein CcmA (Bactofilin family) n=1 Tax=Cellvibrio fibrivorans TaxID=126350 RepID=A0ABU1US39_9GAMM|nr:polymer-forming cytoskeletal protein [Cellvibrio fibrivorans]MDR7088002.1 cytoskeletal protein CcmA (bactofilin family) [Cellvibrio fibrivorans]
MAFSNNHTLISRATKVIGDLHFTGELQLEGKVTGNIIAEDEKDAKVVIADTGVVEGEIRAPVVIVNGKVQGNIYSSKHLELAAKGNVTGTVHYHSIEMVKGAQVNGSMINKQQESASVLDIAVAKA